MGWAYLLALMDDVVLFSQDFCENQIPRLEGVGGFFSEWVVHKSIGVVLCKPKNSLSIIEKKLQEKKKGKPLIYPKLPGKSVGFPVFFAGVFF